MLPNLITIGATKSGTTSLHDYLDLHPQISMSEIKELDFFILEKNWPKGIEWYESNFAFTGETKIVGESSPNYSACHMFSGVPERMYSVLPDVKLIYILRDPVDRIVSHYAHNYRRRIEHRAIFEVLTGLENNPYVLWSKYYKQLEQYLVYFSQSAILILTLDELSQHRHRTLQKVFRFLGVDDSFYSQEFSRISYSSSSKRRTNRVGTLLSRIPGENKFKSLLPIPLARAYRAISSSSVTKPVLDPELKQALIDVLKDDINRLREYTGNDFEAWCL